VNPYETTRQSPQVAGLPCFLVLFYRWDYFVGFALGGKEGGWVDMQGQTGCKAGGLAFFDVSRDGNFKKSIIFED